MRISDWSSDVCSSDLPAAIAGHDRLVRRVLRPQAGHEAAALIVEQDRGPRVGFFGDEAAIDRRDPLRMADIEAVRRQGLHEARLKAAVAALGRLQRRIGRSEEHTSELQSLMRISYAVFCLKKKKYTT